MTINVNGIKVTVSTVLESESEEITEIWSRATTEFDGENRCVVCLGVLNCNYQSGMSLTNSCQFRMFLDNLKLMEKRDKGLVCRLNQEELKRIIVECNAF